MTLATVITFLRIIFIPFFLFFLLKNLYFLASLTFVFLTFTDILDGFLARTGKQKTLVGSLLDPLADKLLLSSTYLVLAIIKEIPFWLFVVVFARDILMICGWIVIYSFTRNISVSPHLLGKMSTVIQSLTVFAILLNLPGQNFLFYLTAGVTLLSGINYLLLSRRKFIYAD